MPDSPLTNPTADTNYVATTQSRADIAAAMTYVRSVESADPEQRKQLLSAKNYDEESYAARKQFLMKKLAGQQAEQQSAADAAGAHVRNLETATSVAEGASKGLNIVGGAAMLQSIGVPAPQAIAGGAILDRVQNFGAEKAVDLFRYAMGNDHPYIEPIVGLIGSGLIGAALLGAIPKAVVPPAGESLKAPAGADAAAGEGEAEGAQGAPEARGAGTPASAASAQPSAPATESAAGGDASEVAKGPTNQPKGAEGGEGISTEPSAPALHARANEPLSPEAEAAVKQLSSNAGDEGAGSGEHNIASMIDAAKAAPMTPEEVGGLALEGEGKHALLATPIDAHDTLRLHYYAADQVSEFMDVFREARDTGNPELQARADELMKEIAGNTMPRWRAALHQAGLGLRVLGSPNEPTTQQMRDVFEAIGSAGDDPSRMAKALGSLPTVGERAELLKRAAATDWTAKGALYNLYVNSILSFNSSGKKLASDLANIIYQVPARGLAELGSRAGEAITGNDYGSMGVAPGETVALTKAMVSSFGKALNYGLHSAITGQPAFEGDVGFMDNPAPASVMAGSGFENSWWGRGIDFFGHMISLPGRSIVAIDQFSKSMQYDMEMAALAQRQGMLDAAGEGLEGAALATRASEIAQGYIEKPADWMLSQAMKTAKTNTFTADLEGSLAKLDAYRRSNYYSRTLMPFFKTPVNITLQGIRQSPLALLSPTFRSTVAGGGPEAALAMSKAALGSAILAYLTSHVLEGNITGGVPENLDAENRKLWLRDHQEYSVKAGVDENGRTRWVSYGGLEPLAWLLGATADMAPAYAYLQSGHAEQATGTLVAAFLREFDRQPMWGALHTLTQALDDAEKGKGEKISEFLGREAASVIPGTISNFAQWTDPVKRQTLSGLDEIRNRIPWLRKNGLATLDPHGDPVVVPPGFMWNEFPSFKVDSKGADPLGDEYIRLHNAVGFKPPRVPSAIGGPADTDNLDAPTEATYGATLTPAEQNRWMELRGQAFEAHGRKYPTLRAELEAMIKSPKYQAMSDAAQANEIHQRFIARQAAAESRLMGEVPTLRPRIVAAYRNKAAAMAPRKTVTASNLVAQ